MNKKCQLLLVLLLINACLLYGEEKTDILVRKSNSGSKDHGVGSSDC